MTTIDEYLEVPKELVGIELPPPFPPLKTPKLIQEIRAAGDPTRTKEINAKPIFTPKDLTENLKTEIAIVEESGWEVDEVEMEEQLKNRKQSFHTKPTKPSDPRRKRDDHNPKLGYYLITFIPKTMVAWKGTKKSMEVYFQDIGFECDLEDDETKNNISYWLNKFSKLEVAGEKLIQIDKKGLLRLQVTNPLIQKAFSSARRRGAYTLPHYPDGKIKHPFIAEA